MYKLLGHSALAILVGWPATLWADQAPAVEPPQEEHWHLPFPQPGADTASSGENAAATPSTTIDIEVGDQTVAPTSQPVKGALESGENQSKPPAPRAPFAATVVPRGFSGVIGKVVDAETGEPLIEATVEVVSGGDGRALTDVDGKFQLDLPPGRYQLRVYYPLYEGRRVRNVNVSQNRAVKLSLRLNSWSESVEEIVVFAEPERRTEAGMLEVRRRASAVADTLSAQEMSRGGDSSASDAVKRVVSVTINEGKYVVLRGLGGRYVSTLLNGVTLPSPEPDRQAVPLDLFPTQLLSNLVVSKSYDPRNPGTFGGGTLLIETNTYPDDLKVSMKASTSANAVTTLRGNPNYAGGSLDVLGFDDGTRALPGAVPTDRAARLSSDGMDAARLESIGESFTNRWAVGEDRAYPNFGLGATVGDTVDLKSRKLGYLASLTYGHSLSMRPADVAKVRNVDDMLQYREQLTSVTGTEEAKLGGLVSTGYTIDDHNQLNLFSLYTHNGSSSAQRVTGFSESDAQEIDATRLRFVEQYLSFNQLQGKHSFPDAGDLSLTWQGNLALTSSDEPDTRDLTYNVLDDGRSRFKNETGSGERYFSELFQRSLGAGLDLAMPVGEKLQLKSGAAIQHDDRDFSARRFRFAFIGTDPSVLYQPAETILSADNIGPSFRIEERTMGTDAYRANLSVAGVYGAAELAATSKLRLAGGVRYERAAQELEPGSAFAATIMELDTVDRVDGDFLPGLSSTYALGEDANLRAAYSYTLARPQFREMAPFLFFDYTRRRSVSGNPELERTRIHNGDVRWEWFPGDADVIAASVFYKRFRDPIEQVIVSAAGGDVSFANAASATAVGMELEAKLGLGHLTPRLDNYKAWANLALIQSKVILREEDVGSQTSATRSLQGQAPYVLNAGFGYSDELYDIYALYNVSGRYIAEVGFDSLPDIYQQPFHRLDFTSSRRLSDATKLNLSATNLLNRSMDLKQGDLNIFSYQPGVGFALSLEWTPRK